MRRPKLYMMLGYPGAGKTSIAEIISNLTGAVHLASDHLRLELFPEPKFTPEEHETLYKTLDNNAQQLLLAGKDVIYDANLNRRQHRIEKYDICHKTNAQPILIWVKTDRQVAKQRAGEEQRSMLWPPTEPADEMFERLVGVFEEPADDEPYIEISGTIITSNNVRQTLGL